jgi:hypothetical protein
MFITASGYYKQIVASRPSMGCEFLDKYPLALVTRNTLQGKRRWSWITASQA